MDSSYKKSIAIIGGGPAALFLYKHLTEKLSANFSVDIFESEEALGAGMPYSKQGANKEHIANVSANEIPQLPIDAIQWISVQPQELLDKFNIDRDNFHEYKVFPRLLLGKYLADQFHLLIEKARKKNIPTCVHLKSKVTDVSMRNKQVAVEINTKAFRLFDVAIICTGHSWPVKNETKYRGYFDSPYPPAKLQFQVNFPVAIRGSSLTAIDAVRTLARQHGKFILNSERHLTYQCNETNPQFKIVMHSISGLLPAVRFHLDDPQLTEKGLLTESQIQDHRKKNGGFVSLDFVFEEDFKMTLKKKDPELYGLIREMKMEEFVDKVMGMRERLHPFLLFKAEYDEALKSMKHKESVHWKEALAILSSAMNYPAKYLCAEDMLRLRKVLFPLIAIVIASVPQSSCEEMLALHEAGRLQIVAVNADSKVTPHEENCIIYSYTDDAGNQRNDHYHVFIDCIGQPLLSIKDFPFKGLADQGDIQQASLPFQSAAAAKDLLKEGNEEVYTKNEKDFYLEVPGIVITDSFAIVDQQGKENDHIYMMAVPYMGGLNPDYSGLGFCNDAAQKIVSKMDTLSKKDSPRKV